VKTIRKGRSVSPPVRERGAAANMSKSIRHRVSGR